MQVSKFLKRIHQEWELLRTTLPGKIKAKGMRRRGRRRGRDRGGGARESIRFTSYIDGIYVRTFEDRMDLMSILFIGPSGTPYPLFLCWVSSSSSSFSFS